MENGYCQFMNSLCYHLREDLSRIQYPCFIKNPSIPTTTLASLRKIANVGPGVSRVSVDDDIEKRFYIFKSIDKPFYEAGDTKIFEQQLHNLKLFRHPNIIQLFSVVISDNPYHINMAQDPCSVLRGFLVEYHPGGTLENALKNHHVLFHVILGGSFLKFMTYF